LFHLIFGYDIENNSLGTLQGLNNSRSYSINLYGSTEGLPGHVDANEPSEKEQVANMEMLDDIDLITETVAK
jgi:hypothetical protein